MFLTDLPLEIRLRISKHCSPSSLAILSRVNTSLRDVAEYALYSHIHYWEENRLLLHTFATNPRKASRVKGFYVELNIGKQGSEVVTRSILVKIAEALKKMPNLVDLRILYELNYVDHSCEDRLNQVIRFASSRFQVISP